MGGAIHRCIGRALASLIVVLALLVPAGAGAHVTLQPEEAPGGSFTTFNLRVPNESGSLTTTKVEVRFPPGFSYALYQPIAGWSVDVKMTKAAKSVIGGQRIPARVGRVIWTALNDRAEIQPEQFLNFPIGVQLPGVAGDTVRFTAIQTYEGGEVVRWSGGPGSRSPAPQILVTDGAEGEDGAAGDNERAAEDSGEDTDGFAIAALIVAMLGLLVGAAALARSSAASGATRKRNGGSEMATQTQVISGTDFITVATQDYERAARFYGETLGLEFSKRWGDMPAGEFETGNLTIAVMQSDAFGIEFRANNHPIEFHVDDFEAAKGELESRGIEFKGDTLDSGVCHQAFFADPDGNALAIHHRYAPPEAAPSA